MNEQAAAAVQAALQAAAPKPADPAALQKILVPMASVSALPELDPDAHFKGKMGGTFGKDAKEVLPNSRRVAIAGFRVAFITENTVSAQVRASYFLGRDSSGASSTLHLVLNGVDYGTMQSIVDKAYADFVAQMKFAGREVVPQEELKEFFSGLELSGGPGKPYTASSGNQSGLTARSAETGAALNMHVAAFGSTWTRADESRGGLTMGGDEGGLSMAAPIASKLEFGTMKEVDSSDNSAVKGIFDALGKAGGMLNAGGAARSKSENVAETTNQAYAAAAVDALGTATGTFAKWFQKYPAK